jgi:hypothetical protein
MGNQTDDPRSSGQSTGSKKSARVGQPGEQHRTSQENAGSTEGGGTRNAGNSIERTAGDSGMGREQHAGGRDQVAKDDGITRDDIEAGNDAPSQSGQIGRNDDDRSSPRRSRTP